MRKLLQIFDLTAMLFVVSACSTNLFEQYDNLPKDRSIREISDVWSPSECTIDEVAVKSFSIKAVSNPSVLADLSFRYVNDSVYTATVLHYNLIGTELVPTWNCVAERVTVNGVDQVPGSSTVDFSQPVRYRFHSSDGQFKDVEFSLKQEQCSGLPVVSLVSEKMISDRYTWVPVTFKVAVPAGGTANFWGSINARYLNDNSIYQEKKSFELEFEDRTSVMDMGGSTHWNLVSNASDKTYLRNMLAGRIGDVLDMSLNPSMRYCELYLNSEYMGLYLLSETVEMDGGGTCTAEPLTVQNPEQSDYLFKMDWNNEAFWFKTAVMELPVNVVYPYELSTDGEKYVHDYFKLIEQCLYQKEEPDPGYRNLVDLTSFAACWIAYELTACESCRTPSSVWYYKNAGGKLCAGPLWNFDRGTFNPFDGFVLRDYETVDFNGNTRSLWYSRLFRDQEFVNAVKKVWQYRGSELRDVVKFADSQASVIEETVKLTLEKWPTDINSNQDSKLSWEDAVDSLKSSYMARWNFLDNSIASW